MLLFFTLKIIDLQEKICMKKSLKKPKWFSDICYKSCQNTILFCRLFQYFSDRLDNDFGQAAGGFTMPGMPGIPM